MKLVDTLEEPALLEQLLKNSKPPTPHSTAVCKASKDAVMLISKGGSERFEWRE